ncbi:MAG: HesA/MoeB/ThiF family protein [Candidatus Hadarchaeales archaeon]
MERYERQLLIGGFDRKTQRKLRSARVVIVGLGGLGSPASIYLAAAGIGRMTLVDCERVEMSNLNRQVVHFSDDVGKLKVDSAADKIGRLNPEVSLDSLSFRLTRENVSRVVRGADVVIDAVDNYPTRFLLNEACVRHGVPLVHGAVDGFDGQAMTIVPGRGPCLRCLLPRDPAVKERIPVLGPAPGVIGCIEAMESIKLITGIGKPLIGRMLIFSGKEMRFEEIEVRRNPGCPVCGGR